MSLKKKRPKIPKLSKKTEKKYNIEAATIRLDEGIEGLRKVKRYKGAANRAVLNPYLADIEKSMIDLRKEINKPNATSRSVQEAWDKFYYFTTIDRRKFHIGAGKTKGARTRSRRKIDDMISEATRNQIGAQYYYKNHFKHVKTDHYKTMKGHRRSDGYVYRDDAVQLNTTWGYVWKVSGWVAPASKQSKVKGWNSAPVIYSNETIYRVHSWHKTRDEARTTAERLKDAGKIPHIAETKQGIPWGGLYVFEKSIKTA